MELTLKNYQTVLSKDLLKHAEKTKVRECDEIEKGQYVAYVDEGEESFDVSLAISPKKEVLDHSCECKNSNSFCRHKAAYTIILQFFEPMPLTNRYLLLKAFIDKKSDYGWEYYFDDTEKDAACFPELYERIVKHFPLDYLRKAVEKVERSAWHLRSNHFLEYMKRLFVGK